MKNTLVITLFCLALINVLFVDFQPFSNIDDIQPLPTNGQTMIHHGEEASKGDAREEWLELLHQAAPGTDWRAIEHQTRLKRHQAKSRSPLQFRSGCDGGLFAEGLLSGSWYERGSINQAGSVFDTE